MPRTTTSSTVRYAFRCRALGTLLMLLVMLAAFASPGAIQSASASSLGTTQAILTAASIGADDEEKEANQEADAEKKRNRKAMDTTRGKRKYFEDEWKDSHSAFRSSAPLISWWKFALLVVLYLAWVRMADWINRDAQDFSLNHAVWNPIAVFGLAVTLLVTLFVAPWEFGFPVAVVAFLSILISYVVLRNRSVAVEDKAFTKDWFRVWFSGVMRKLGVKVDAVKKQEHEKGVPLDITARGADHQQNQANLILARQSPGYLMMKDLVVDMIDKRAEKALASYSPSQANFKYQIDGVWHDSGGREREPADMLLAVLKTLCNLDITERQKPQRGTFDAKHGGDRYLVHVQSKGTANGEDVLIKVVDPRPKFMTLEELGMRESLRERWLTYLGSDDGFLITSAMPSDGITTLCDSSIFDTDRLMRDWVALEDKTSDEHEFENVEVTTFNKAGGESPATVIPTVSRKYPDVYIVRDLVDGESAALLFQEVRDERLVITTVKAKDAADALVRLMALKIPKKEYAMLVTAVAYQRLVRKLCESCRMPYEPTPDILKRLRIPPGKIQVLYRSPKPEERDKPCEACNGIGFHGRAGIFELLEVNNETRQILTKQPDADLIRRAARTAGMRNLQEEGVLLVAKGVTSLPELMRVMKK